MSTVLLQVCKYLVEKVHNFVKKVQYFGEMVHDFAKKSLFC